MRLPKISGLVVLAVALAGLILALGALQWRWVREASEAEQGRMQSLLDARAAQFAHDFDRELTAIYGWFALLHRQGGARAVAGGARRAVVRGNVAPAIGPSALPGAGATAARRFGSNGSTAAAGGFRLRGWPADLEGLRERLTKSRPAPGLDVTDVEDRPANRPRHPGRRHGASRVAMEGGTGAGDRRHPANRPTRTSS